MADDRTLNEVNVTENNDGEFLQRWSRRKSALRNNAAESVDLSEYDTSSPPPVEVPAPVLDLPPVENLDEHSDVSGFLSPEVSGDLRKLALNKLFHLPKFNVTDGLDDYDDNYRNFAALGDIITADMRHHMERAAENAKQALLEEEEKQLDPGTGKVSKMDERKSVIDEEEFVQQGDDTYSKSQKGEA